jgi:hypothetical protein
MYYLELDNNNLDGSIPSSIGNLYLLSAIHVGNNTLEGKIPTELAQCKNLKDMRFQINNLTGDIGSVINARPQSLTGLDLTDNLFSGTIPPSIGTFTNLDFLDFGDNSLNGTIPTEIGLLSKLEVLDLYSNRFTGTVPSSLASLPLSKSHTHSCTILFRRYGCSRVYIFLVTEQLNIFDNDLTGSLDAFCVLADLEGFERLAANTCDEQDEIACYCCTHCCDPEKGICTKFL